jgi:hypothetical protein
MKKTYAVIYIELGTDLEPQEEVDYALNDVKELLESKIEPLYHCHLEDVIIAPKRR